MDINSDDFCVQKVVNFFFICMSRNEGEIGGYFWIINGVTELSKLIKLNELFPVLCWKGNFVLPD